MTDPTARALRLLSLLQTHRHWSGAELAERLAVTERTLRRDVDRLRELGYRVESRPGAAGGYQLAGGGTLPPLLLDDDEAVSIAVGLRTAALHGVGQGEQTSLSALAKIEQVLPPRLRRRVTAVATHTVPSVQPDPLVDAEDLARLALLCRDKERLRFEYTGRDGTPSRRHVEPHSLVPQGRRWYFVAWDVDRADWRTFRVDRMAGPLGTGARFTPHRLPAADAAEFVQAAHAATTRRIEATVHLEATPEAVRGHFGGWAGDAVEGPGGTVDWPIGGASVPEVLMALLWIPADMPWTITAPPDVVDAIVGLRRQLARAV